MTIQQWLFSFKGRIGRRDFWVWIVLWVLAMVTIFTLAGKGMLDLQTAAFILVCLLWPTAAVVVKRLHDRGRSGWWAMLVIVAWLLLVGNWDILSGMWEWAVGRLIPTVLMVSILVDLGAILGADGENRYGKQTDVVSFTSSAPQ